MRLRKIPSKRLERLSFAHCRKIGAIIYYIVLQVVLQLGLNTNDLKLISALIVAVFLAIPYWKSKLTHVKAAPAAGKGGSTHA